MTPTTKGLCLSMTLIAIGSTTAVLADDRVIREHTFNTSDIKEIEIHASVGSIDILPTDDDEISLVLDIEGKDHGWFRQHKDVSDVELHSRVRGDRLILRQTEDDTRTEWTIRLPATARTVIHMGVGEISGEVGATNLDIDLGVGEVDIEYPLAAAGDINVNVGVGEAKLRGTSDVSIHKAFVSQQLSGSGEGSQDIDIHIGVGDASLRLL